MIKNLEELTNMYVEAAGLRPSHDKGIYYTPRNKKIRVEDIKGSAEFAGFMDAMQGNPIGIYGIIGISNGVLKDLEDDIKELIHDFKEFWRNIKGWESGGTSGHHYLEGYFIGMTYKVSQLSKTILDVDGADEAEKDYAPLKEEGSGQVLRPDPSVWIKKKNKNSR